MRWQRDTHESITRTITVAVDGGICSDGGVFGGTRWEDATISSLEQRKDNVEMLLR